MNCRQFGTLVLAACLTPATTAQPEAAPEYDLAVIGGSGGGIACAVRAAREGLRVLLVNYSNHLGGMLSGGIGVMDTLYEGRRAPILDEYSQRVADYYAKIYGRDSTQFRAAAPGHLLSHPTPKRLTFEPHVAEKVIDDMVGGEKNITVLRGFHPSAVERNERTIVAVHLKSFANGQSSRVTARIFADATYEGDLFAAAGVAYRVGREAREEFGEPHAGRIFSKRIIAPADKGAFPAEAAQGKLNLRPFQAVTQEIYAGSTGEGDSLVQAYHYRLCLTNDPANRRLPDRPANYDSEILKALLDPYRTLGNGRPNQPNSKSHWFQNFSGGAEDYPTAGWPRRRQIMQRHRDFALGAVYFFQNDPSIPEAQRAKAREWGLPKDEFKDNDNFPYEMYIREARRMVGRYVFTELDATTARGYSRTPIHEDSIAIGEWFLDSHEVSTERQPGSDHDGKIILSELTRPSQIPWRTLLPQDIDNLLVPVCLSATHVGWGTIRLEPTWMHIAESAAIGAAMAVREGVAPASLVAAKLQRRLVEKGIMLSFFNDADMAAPPRWIAAVQYLGTKGFFPNYDARGDAPLGREVARLWARGAGELGAGKGNGNALARAIHSLKGEGSPVTGADFAAMLRTSFDYWSIAPARPFADAASAPMTRGEACRMIYEALP
jgi:hypothetical protein